MAYGSLKRSKRRYKRTTRTHRRERPHDIWSENDLDFDSEYELEDWMTGPEPIQGIQ